MTDQNALQAKEKQEVTASAEPTTAGIVFTPEVDIFESEHALILTV